MRTALVYNFLIEANLMASIAILLMIPIRLFARKQLGNRAICLAWLMVAIRLLCPLSLPNPAIHEIRSSFAPDEAIRPIAGQIQVRFSDAVDALYDGAVSAGVGGDVEDSLYRLRRDTGNGMLSIRLMKVYLAGAALVTAWFVFSNRRFCRQLRADSIEPVSGKAQAQYEALCREMGIAKPIPVHYVDPLPSACLVGCLRPWIALPLTVRPQEMENVLRHELCHYRAKDHWWNLVRLVCCAMHWFNPLVWAAARMSRTDSELACDERVIRRMDESARREYADVLVLAACRRDLPGVSVLSTGMSMTGRRLKRRVAGILAQSQARRGLALSFVLLAGMALVGAFATRETPKIGNVPTGEVAAYTEALPGEITVEIDAEAQEALIEAAKSFWGSEVLGADVNDQLEWRVQAYDTHTEVHAYETGWGDALIVAFAPDGRVVYMNNRRSGDRDALSDGAVASALKQTELLALKQHILDVVPGLDDSLGLEIDDLIMLGLSKNGESRFCRFAVYEDEQITIAFAVQYDPQVRLTWYQNALELDPDTIERLEPGNG